MTALQVAAFRSSIDIVVLLLDRGEGVEAADQID